ncbi:MAG: endonuclease V [Rhodospirillaceae bacterium]
MRIAVLDVHYKKAGARGACVVADAWEAPCPIATYTEEIEAVEPYEPGSFYRRELPCLLAVLRLLPALPDTVIIDGYVWLPSMNERPGLGAHLYEALGRQTAVIGVAKTAFIGAESSPIVVPVLRGASRVPIFVTAAGMYMGDAAQHVRHMAGKHRIPTLLRLADRLCRSAP